MIIYKYALELITQKPFSILMHKDARVISFQFQNQHPIIWAVVDKEKVLVPTEFLIMGTGFEFPSGWVGEYIGTWQDTPFVWHLFKSSNLGDAKEVKAK